jgi:hypothetical protein
MSSCWAVLLFVLFERTLALEAWWLLQNTLKYLVRKEVD